MKVAKVPKMKLRSLPAAAYCLFILFTPYTTAAGTEEIFFLLSLLMVVADLNTAVIKQSKLSQNMWGELKLSSTQHLC